MNDLCVAYSSTVNNVNGECHSNSKRLMILWGEMFSSYTVHSLHCIVHYMGDVCSIEQSVRLLGTFRTQMFSPIEGCLHFRSLK